MCLIGNNSMKKEKIILFTVLAVAVVLFILYKRAAIVIDSNNTTIKTVAGLPKYLNLSEILTSSMANKVSGNDYINFKLQLV